VKEGRRMGGEGRKGRGMPPFVILNTPQGEVLEDKVNCSPLTPVVAQYSTA